MYRKGGDSNSAGTINAVHDPEMPLAICFVILVDAFLVDPNLFKVFSSSILRGSVEYD
jgi:hypothetical protein